MDIIKAIFAEARVNNDNSGIIVKILTVDGEALRLSLSEREARELEFGVSEAIADLDEFARTGK